MVMMVMMVMVLMMLMMQDDDIHVDDADSDCLPTTTIMNPENAFHDDGDDDADVDNYGDYADLSHIGDLDYCTS